jgi:hypothetical protein
MGFQPIIFIVSRSDQLFSLSFFLELLYMHLCCRDTDLEYPI